VSPEALAQGDYLFCDRSGTSRASGGKPFFFSRIRRDGLLERRVSPEASSSAKASEDIPRSFNEGELAQGDCLFVIALEPPELRVASHFSLPQYVVMEHFSGANG
jgi:hypothetical protein